MILLNFSRLRRKPRLLALGVHVSGVKRVSVFPIGIGSSEAKGANGTSVSRVNFLPKYSPLERFPNLSFFDS
jgi:hypothetical protein